jgi:hypothetical protein
MGVTGRFKADPLQQLERPRVAVSPWGAVQLPGQTMTPSAR